jgi:hypothetical protein
MSDSSTGQRSAGFGSLSDAKRIERFDLDAFFGPGMVKGDDGRWSPAVTGALYLNSEDEIELRTDGVTLVQENASPTTLKGVVPASVTRSIAVVAANGITTAARLTSGLAAVTADVEALDDRVDALESAPPAHVHDGADITTGVIDPDRLGTGGGGAVKFLREDGTYQAIPGGGDALVANPLSQFAATTSLQLAGVMTDETGSGALVFATSPTIVTPTVASFVNATHAHTNAAGGGALDAAAISTGTIAPARLGSGSGGAVKFLREDSTFQAIAAGGDALTTDTLAQFASTTSAEFESVISDGTGTAGKVVFSDGPSLTNPALGTPASGVLTNCTGTAAGLTAGTVTTKANLTGDVTSVGNAATIPTSVISAAARTVTDDATVAAMVNTLGGSASTGSNGLVRETSPTIVTPTIASFTNATHTHLNAAGGGTLSGSAIASGTVAIARLPTASPNRYVKAGTTNYVSLMVPGLSSGVTLSTKTLVNGTAFAVPFIAPDRGGTLDQVEVYVTTGVAATNVRFGIYGNLGEADLYPGSLTIDCGAFASITSSQQRLASISQALTAGALYWFVIVSDGAPAIRGGSTNQAGHILGTTSLAATTWTTHLSATMAYGALPGTFPTLGATAVTGAFPAAGLRFSA